MVPFIETIHSKNDLINEVKKYVNPTTGKPISGYTKNDFFMFFSFIHGEAIDQFFGGDPCQLYLQAGFNSGSKAYCQAGYNAYLNLKKGNYTFPPFNVSINKPHISNFSSCQKIYYGAPGTGKSHQTNKVVRDYPDTIRTTFHPDMDYASFVGSYKPVMKECKVHAFPVTLKQCGYNTVDGAAEFDEEKISYSFTQQAFTKAYILAWKKMMSARIIDSRELSVEKQFLVIEEINRGNCAQIFGDLFQLLDRKNGFSEYPIVADDDLRKELQMELQNLIFDQNVENYINELFVDNAGKKMVFYTDEDASRTKMDRYAVDAIKNGKILVLPCNFYILATMNTSDQSLFPMDSAFKRRWDWEYVPINVSKEKWSIVVGDKVYSWSQFLININRIILETTKSEDKQLGFYFYKSLDNTIPVEIFVNKVLFYLYNDVFKDYLFETDLFKDQSDSDNENAIITFQSLFDAVTGAINCNKVEQLLNNLEIEGSSMADYVSGNESNTMKDFTKYSIDGVEGKFGKNRLPYEYIKQYINKYNCTTTQVLADFDGLIKQRIVPHFLESAADYASRGDHSQDSSEVIKCSDGDVYVSIDGYKGKDHIRKFIDYVNAKDWGMPITELP